MLGHGAIGQFAIGEAAAITPETITLDKWFVPLSEPLVKVKQGLRAAEQQFLAAPPFPPFVPWGWFEPLAEPTIKIKRGLLPSEQQFLAWPPRLLPTATITGTLNAIETKDTMAAGGREFNAPVTVKVGFIEQAFAGLAGLIEKSS